jgi:flagellar motor switch protein FliN/FliY
MNPLDETARLADVPVPIEMILDRRTMTLAEILELEVGSLLRLTRSAGENIDVYVGDVLLGYGEVVVIESALGVRITDFAHEL